MLEKSRKISLDGLNSPKICLKMTLISRITTDTEGGGMIQTVLLRVIFSKGGGVYNYRWCKKSAHHIPVFSQVSTSKEKYFKLS